MSQCLCVCGGGGGGKREIHTLQYSPTALLIGINVLLLIV